MPQHHLAPVPAHVVSGRAIARRALRRPVALTGLVTLAAAAAADGPAPSAPC